MPFHRQIAKRRAPKAQIFIDRERFRLTLWRLDSKGIYRKTYFPIAIGKVGDATPAGAYYIDAKTRRPAWLVPPHDDYPPEIWNTIIPYSHPNNPFEGGFLSFSGGDGVGIHGVRFDPRLGERASHGCIRVATPTIKFLYTLVPLGTPVQVK
jgi:L,D-transpeptidase ErfK/SrfK